MSSCCAFWPTTARGPRRGSLREQRRKKGRRRGTRLAQGHGRERAEGRVGEDGVEEVRVDRVEDAREAREVDDRREHGDEEVERHLREGGDVLGQALVGVVDVAVELDAVVGAVLVVLLREFAGHPLAPAQGQALALELVEHRQRRRDREPHRVVGRLLLEDGQVLGRQRAVEVAAHEAKNHRDAALAEHEDEEEAELQLRALGLLEVRLREPPEEVEAFLDRRVDAQSAVVHRQGSFVAAAAVSGRRPGEKVMIIYRVDFH